MIPAEFDKLKAEVEQHLSEIERQAEKLTPGNVAHHRAAIITIANYLKSLLNENN
jgi:hypothetical protein